MCFPSFHFICYRICDVLYNFFFNFSCHQNGSRPKQTRLNLSRQVPREERLVVHFTEEGCVSQLKATFVKYCIQNKGFEHT